LWDRYSIEVCGSDIHLQYVVVDFLWYRKLAPGASVGSPGYDTIDQWGRPVPDPDRWPSSQDGSGLARVAQQVHDMGLKFGIHVMRGISTAAVQANTPIFGAKVHLTPNILKLVSFLQSFIMFDCRL